LHGLARAIHGEFGKRWGDVALRGGADTDGDAIGTIARDALSDVAPAQSRSIVAEGINDSAEDAAGFVGFGIFDDAIDGGAKDDEHDRGEGEHEEGVDEGEFFANTQAGEKAAGGGNPEGAKRRGWRGCSHR
jgi:hypothetical protein